MHRGRAVLGLLLALVLPAVAMAQDAPPLASRTTAPAGTGFTLDVLAPGEGATHTAREFVNVLGRTTPGALVQVGGVPVSVFATGVFARDRIPLAPGANRIVLEATAPDGQRLLRLLDIERTPPAPGVAWPGDRLYLDGRSLRPDTPQQLAPGETVEVAVHATPGQRVQARLPGQAWQTLPEAGAASGRYRARLAFAGHADVETGPVQLRVVASNLPRRGRRAVAPISTVAPGTVGQWRADPERLYAVGPEGAELLHGLHEVRLGGPFLAELPPGTLLQATGARGQHLRVQLAPDTTAWVAAAALVPAAPGTRAPHAAFTSLAVSGGDEGDVVSIPLPEGLPHAVRAVADAAGRQQLEIELYGAHHAATWITHRAGARVVRELGVEQAGPERVRVRVALHDARLWGWRVERTPAALRVLVRRPPVLATSGSPLAGLCVALEPGHGGPDNLGAVGATGVPEKDINRWTVLALQAELQAAGAQVVVVREGDEAPSLRERARRVLAADAQLFVSVHANATDTAAGYLRVAGTSTFYKHAHARDLAAAVQARLLQHTGLDDFGLVGNFNYTPIRRVSWAPAVLVEQAFLSHPGDEARLLDAEFRATLARAVRLGLEDYLRPR